MLYLILLVILFCYTFYKLYIKYTLEIIYNLASIIAFIPYYFNIRKKLIESNLKIVFPTITKIRQNSIRFHSWKFLIINILTCLNQYLFKNSYLFKYYTINNINLPRKSFITLAHFGLYYDFTSFFKLTQNIFYGIYKSKNFNLNFNHKIKTVKHDKINILEINKYHTLYTPIDQKCSSKNETVLFLNKYLTFHSSLIQQSIHQERDIIFYYVVINNYKLYPKLIKIETKDKSIHDIVQSIASEMTTVIKQYPEQYLWSHNRFSIN
jgi:lauroyl/myristoyl acyltransferase